MHYFIHPSLDFLLPEGQRSTKCTVFALRYVTGSEDTLHPPQVTNYVKLCNIFFHHRAHYRCYDSLPLTSGPHSQESLGRF